MTLIEDKITNKSPSLKKCLEEIDILGYTIIHNVISKSDCEIISKKLDEFFEEEKHIFGEEKLKNLLEWGTIRALISKDLFFEKTILNKTVFEIISGTIGDTAILHLHNGIAIQPGISHRQARFHRDFEKNFSSIEPLSLNVFWAIDDFTETSGGTWVVPSSHRIDFPSTEFLNKHAIQVSIPKGSVIVFDSRLIHKGGENKSDYPRRALNHQYTKPFIKQQIDFTSLLKDKIDLESKLAQVLGFWSRSPKSVEEFRCEPKDRSYRSGQG